jgi:hypothetical protein
VEQLYDVGVENFVAFILSPGYFCEEVVKVCKTDDYKELDP